MKLSALQALAHPHQAEGASSNFIVTCWLVILVHGKSRMRGCRAVILEGALCHFCGFESVTESDVDPLSFACIVHT